MTEKKRRGLEPSDPFSALRSPSPGIVLTDEQKRRRRARSIALALALGALALLFYVVTLIKGPGVLVRPL